MHTNAGMVTALQQAVAHLSSALEILPNTDINMLMCTCSNMDEWLHAKLENMLTNIDKVCNHKAHTMYFLYHLWN